MGNSAEKNARARKFEAGYRRYLLADPTLCPDGEAAAFCAGFIEACRAAGLSDFEGSALLTLCLPSVQELALRGAALIPKLDDFHKAQQGTVQ